MTTLSPQMEMVLQKILSIFEGFRLQVPTQIDQYNIIGRDILANKMRKFIVNNMPIEFVMPAFPFKSINTRDKVLSERPDLAEAITLRTFAEFNIEVSKVYHPGIRLFLVTDGLVFNDVIGITDKTTINYHEEVKDMSNQLIYSPIEWMNLMDFYNTSSNFQTAREKLFKQFGITEEQMMSRILTDPDVNYIYKGMLIFMEEETAMNSFSSHKAHKRYAKQIVRQAMLRNEAYSALIRHEFPDAVRISMHKSVNNGAKYSIQLIRSPLAYHSAWHCAVALHSDGTIETVHRIDADAKGYELVYKEGRPQYYMAS